ncbi:MAG: HDOD domain-containing protein [Pirellulales bacterium]
MPPKKFPSVDLEQILSAARLPAMPQSALRILEVSRDPDAGVYELAVSIEADPGLTVQVLRFVNSSYFGFRYEISSVKQAVALVGMRTVKHFALYSAVFSLIPNPRCGRFDLKKLWQDSLRRALFSRRMSRLLTSDEAEESFAAALLQDMAVPLLAKEIPGAYDALFEARRNGAVRLSALEGPAFGWNHAEAAGRMARNWKLPEAVSTLIEHHLEIDHSVACAERAPARSAVALSALLPSLADEGWPERAVFEKGYAQVRPSGAPTIAELLAAVDEDFADFAPVLKVSEPRRSLAAMSAEAAETVETAEVGG